MSRWRRKLEQEPDRGPSLPLRPGPVTNGEFVPAAASRRDRQVGRLILDRIELAAGRTGVDRRRFLQSGAGVAASLALFNACRDGSESASTTSTTAAPRTTSTAGGEFEVPEPEEVIECEQALSGDEFIFDVHTHHVVPDGPWRQNAQRIAEMISGLVPAACVEADPFRCLDRTAYLHDLFLASDTTVALLSDVPNSGPLDAPVPWEEKRETRDLAATLAAPGADRVLIHDVIAPNFGDLSMRLGDMERTAGTGDLAAFKVYTAWGPGQRGFALDDPAIGIPVVDKAVELGVDVMCAHKGLPLLEFDRAHNGPEDMVRLSRRYPQVKFVVYHGAFERETTELAYRPGSTRAGIDSLIRALEQNGVGPGENVYAEVGTTWREVLSNPDEAAHTIGKLVKHLGPDNVLWGTDAIWLGSPQPQIMAFRAFQITEAFQDQYGYPALTDELKRKIFGLNAAAVFGVDVDATRCAVDGDELSVARAEYAGLVEDGAVTSWQARGPMSRRDTLAWLAGLRRPWTP
jgi:uncharacterized protein